MNKLSRFAGRAKEVKIDGDTFKFYPLSVKDQDLLYDYGKSGIDNQKIMRDLIKLSLKDEKDITADDIDNMTLGAKNIFVKHVMEVNGMKDEIDKAQEKLTGESPKA